MRQIHTNTLAGLALSMAFLTGCAPTSPPVAGAAADAASGAPRAFAAKCAQCHGPLARGDGRLAPELAVPPPDLTTLRDRAGGVFPADRVMAQIYGYPGRYHLGLMPEFSPGLSGPLVPWRTQDGKVVPTPQELIGLVGYLEALQR